MYKKELNRFSVLEKVKNGQIKLKKVSKVLNLSYRQTRRIYKSFLLLGAKGLIHGNRGKESNNKIAEEIRNKVLTIIAENYSESNPNKEIFLYTEKEKNCYYR